MLWEAMGSSVPDEAKRGVISETLLLLANHCKLRITFGVEAVCDPLNEVWMGPNP